MTNDHCTDGTERIIRCQCDYETSHSSPVAVKMDGSCPECGRPLEADTDHSEEA